MRHPSEYYIRALIYQGLPNQDIYHSLFDLGIYAPGEEVIQSIRRAMGEVVGSPAEIAEENEEALAYVQRKGISRFFSEEETMAVIIEHIMKNSSIRTLCERSLLAKIEYSLLDDMVREELDRQRLFSVLLDQRTLRIYKHFFWNTDLMSSSEMLIFLQKAGANWHVESLIGGRDHQLYRTGKKNLEVPPDEAHHIMMNDLLLRSMFLSKLPFTEETDHRAVGIAKAFSVMWKNAKTVGNADMKDAYEELRKVTEQRRNADKEIAKGGRDPMPGEEDDDEDDDI